jgi:hypothetical protein
MTRGGKLYLLPKSAHRTCARDSGSLLPTPTANTYGSNQGGAAGRTGKVLYSLESMAKRGMFPTPNSRDWKDTGVTQGNRKSPNLGTVVARMYPTPTKSSANGAGSHGTGGDNLQTVIGGKLNPTWVEWLMGWPLGATDLKPLETDKYREWCRKHGKD